MYPIEKYKYYVAGNKVIAVSTYAGRTVRGVAACAPGDKFDLEAGKRLAAARCALKIATKRRKRAQKKIYEADLAFMKAERYEDDMCSYLDDAILEEEAAIANLELMLKEI